MLYNMLCYTCYITCNVMLRYIIYHDSFLLCYITCYFIIRYRTCTVYVVMLYNMLSYVTLYNMLYCVISRYITCYVMFVI